jgi:zinc transporter ZupT
MTEPVAIPIQAPTYEEQPVTDNAEAILAIKIVSLFIVPAIGFAGVLLPMFVKKIRENEKILSYCNVISGALLLGFGFLSMLPDAQAEFAPFKESASGFPIIEALVFLSFFLVLTVEHFMNGLIAKADANVGHELHDDKDTKKVPLLGGAHNSVENGNVTVYDVDSYVLHSDEHTHKKKPNQVLPYLLVAGLGFHSVFEGLVLGLGTNFHSVLILFIAIAVSMFGEGFAMGVSFLKAEMTRKKSLIITAIFVVLLPLGTIIGIILQKSPDVDETTGALISAIASAIAVGIFLYTATISVFTEEFGKPDGHVYIKIVCAVVVFMAMGCLKLLEESAK